jgi:hypothetical protein
MMAAHELQVYSRRQQHSSVATREAHRSRTRRRPRPREGLLVGIRAGIVSMCIFRIAPRGRGVGDAFRACFLQLANPGLKPRAESYNRFAVNTVSVLEDGFSSQGAE